MYFGYCYEDDGSYNHPDSLKSLNEVEEYLLKKKNEYVKVVVVCSGKNFAESENGWIVYPVHIALNDIRKNIITEPFSVEEFREALLRIGIFLTDVDQKMNTNEAAELIDKIELLYSET